ncbi:hypothetical protein [Microcoleus sp.]|uniref:hypothetical protein n=1 Tax=Microcoleus sp. TaxID=44472 RepID=UPI0035938319
MPPNLKLLNLSKYLRNVGCIRELVPITHMLLDESPLIVHCSFKEWIGFLFHPHSLDSPGFMVDTVSDTTVRDSVMPLE